MEKLIIGISLCFFFVSFNKNSIELSKVDTFINILKEDRNERLEASNLNIEDISDLLEYRNDQQVISNFPRNPLSSFALEEVTIGIYTLWNIESIRIREIDSLDHYLFASLNPRIIRTSTGELVNQNEILSEVATAYVTWWTSSLSLEEKLQTNPLEGLDLSWN